MAERYHFGPFRHGASSDFVRADLEFYGINHFRPTYVASIFFNDPDVIPEDAKDKRASYAGNFAVFGHATCYGSDGHCEVTERSRRFDNRPSHPLTRAFKRVTVTDALRKAMEQGEELTVTIIADCGDDPLEDQTPLLDFNGLQLVTFD